MFTPPDPRYFPDPDPELDIECYFPELEEPGEDIYDGPTLEEPYEPRNML